ncbi:hypothetical protein QYF61_008592 [Mycteria americana]|uniref:Uncharacterized protein n=1 Tax=Mycteria americana TaxID=33587 RepID=A0AAN7PC78_MYCAM|nr:hypothetical protein QYF61_008592 [Mycteria americana]
MQPRIRLAFWAVSAHCQLMSSFSFTSIPSPSLQGCSQSLHPLAWVALTQVQDLALGLIEPHEVHKSPLLQLVHVPLDGILSLRRVNRTTQLGVICKLAEGALDPTVYVIDEDIKQYWSQYRPLRDITCHQSLSGNWVIDHYPLDVWIDFCKSALSGLELIQDCTGAEHDAFASLTYSGSTICITPRPAAVHVVPVWQERASKAEVPSPSPPPGAGYLLPANGESRFCQQVPSEQSLPQEGALKPTFQKQLLQMQSCQAQVLPEHLRTSRVPAAKLLSLLQMDQLGPGVPSLGPLPMLDNPLGEEKFPNIQSKPPLAQLEAISSCPITCYLGEETDPHLSTTSFQVVVESDEVSPEPPFLQAKQPQLPQPLLIRLVLQTLHQLRCPSLDSLQHLNVSLVVRGPKLNTVFEVRPHQCRVQGHDHFPSPAGHAIFDTSQDVIGFLGHLGTLLAHIQPAVDQHPQALLCLAALSNRSDPSTLG